MSTIYTLNGKVLKNSANDKWLIKAPPPEEVTIGTQIWKTKNLAIDDGQGGIYTQTVNYGQGNVTEYYYTWDAAVRVAASISGWHLASNDEWTALANAIGGASTGGKKLKSTYGWTSGNGTNDYGFTVLPTGYRLNGEFRNFGTGANFWTATSQSSTQAAGWYFGTYDSMSSSLAYNKTNYNLCVRLIKDSE